MDEEQPEAEKGFKGARLTKLEAMGRKRADQGNWRKKLQASKLKFDDVQKQVYLKHLAQFGRKQHACKAAGVCFETVAKHIENDAEFASAREAAMQDYADAVQQLAYRLMNGTKKPIIGVDKGTSFIIGHELVHATNLLAMEMKKTNPAYKERSEVDLNGGTVGGVLLVPAGMNAEDFIKVEQERTGHMEEPGADIK
jgi:hypothetical protein